MEENNMDRTLFSGADGAGRALPGQDGPCPVKTDSCAAFMLNGRGCSEKDCRFFSSNWVDEFSYEGSRYGIENIVRDGCFIPKKRLSDMLDTLRERKNLLLRGPRGCGKTWLAMRLGHALTRSRDSYAVRAVRFRPGMTADTFVRGLRRPDPEWSSHIEDGPFVQAIDRAREYCELDYVLILEDIHCDPAGILGEALPLLDADCRYDVALLREEHERQFPNDCSWRLRIPDNLHVIGTMPPGEPDPALLRSFAVFDIASDLGTAWQEWMLRQGFPLNTIFEIRNRFTALNDLIRQDPALGPQRVLGHGFVTAPLCADGNMEWYRGAVERSIAPVLAEYWPDSPDRVRELCGDLLRGLVTERAENPPALPEAGGDDSAGADDVPATTPESARFTEVELPTDFSSFWNRPQQFAVPGPQQEPGLGYTEALRKGGELFVDLYRDEVERRIAPALAERWPDRMDWVRGFCEYLVREYALATKLAGHGSGAPWSIATMISESAWAAVRTRLITYTEVRMCLRALLIPVLENAGGRIDGEYGAAEMLGIEPSVLSALIEQLGI
ncbi:MAG: AAA family ATPase, partial [Desulfovibrionaceae bacterium]|nr:AAA family ATPase [Desulfovibrionaceae bacterium]